MSRADLRDEAIPELNIIVYKTLVDPSTAKLIGEREKVKRFTTMGILRPKAADIKFTAFEKLYEPFFILNGRYFIDYFRKRVYKLDVEDDVTELVICDRVFQPQTPTLAKVRGKGRAVELVAEQRIITENAAYTILDKTGKDIDLDTFTTAPAEEEPQNVLADAGETIVNLEIAPNKALEIFRSKVVHKPTHATRINKELFEVSEYNLVYVPIYQATYQNVKTDKTKRVTVDGVTSQLLARHIERSGGTPQKMCSGCGQRNEENAKYCRECGHHL